MDTQYCSVCEWFHPKTQLHRVSWKAELCFSHLHKRSGRKLAFIYWPNEPTFSDLGKSLYHSFWTPIKYRKCLFKYAFAYTHTHTHTHTHTQTNLWDASFSRLEIKFQSHRKLKWLVLKQVWGRAQTRWPFSALSAKGSLHVEVELTMY